MNRICIGILDLTPGWQSLLDQIGIWYEEISPTLNFEKSYSTIIINGKPNPRLLKKLNVYLQSKGTILVPKNAKSVRFFYERTPHSALVFPFHFNDSIQFSNMGEGLIADLKFDPDEHLSNNHFSRQRFYFKPEKHPDELVSTVNKEILLDAVTTCLKHLHFHRGLPFVQKWHSPEINPIFCFRVDSDWGDKDSMKNLYDLGSEFGIPMTWFLHVQAHEEWLDFFRDFENQEIALHGYEHGTSTSFEQVMNNIERGKQLLIDSNYSPKGFCAPYGVWNDALGNVLQSFDFEYSSEFTLGYDTLPFFPVFENELHPTLQIPIHPICTGSLNRKNTSEPEMKEYFLQTLEKRTNQYRNTIFYHHPLQPGLDIWRDIFEQVNEKGLTKLTFFEHATFWKERITTRFEPMFDPLKGVFHLESSNKDMFVQLSLEHDTYYLLKAEKADQPLDSFTKITPVIAQELNVEQKEELTTHPLALMKTSFLDWKNRKRL
ncbi:MAG: polysaccharide deacetylase family protein [Balneolales bacterium]|nr:polysaccharide deacetylase family protein [Balneolales bacterium]